MLGCCVLPNGLGAGAEVEAGAAGFPKNFEIAAVPEGVDVDEAAEGLPNANVGAATVDVAVFIGSEAVLEELVGNGRVDVWAGSVGLEAEEGIERAGRSDVEAFTVDAEVGVAGLAKENDVLALEASAGCAAEEVSDGLAVVAVAGNAIGAVVVAVIFFSTATSSAFTFSLSLAMAAASRSCFSHFE